MSAPSEYLRPKSPATGQPLGEVGVATAAQIEDAFDRARSAFPRWRDTAVADRVSYVHRIRTGIIDRLDDVVAHLSEATGKPPMEALASDVIASVDMLRYYESTAEATLADEPRKGTAFYRLNRFTVTYQPMGVVVVIAPWNHPLQLALIPVVTALLAGNTVLLKPSELTPTVGTLIGDLCDRAGLPSGVLQVLQGDGRVGQALVEAGPDKVFFTGSVATGKKIMRTAAEQLTPLELELGGSDPMIVFDDARFERAVGGALYGAFVHAGQNCVSIERCYVQRGIYPRFVERLAAEAQKLRVGSSLESDYGPLIRDAQRAELDRLIADAVDKGARVVTPVQWDGNRLRPVVLADVDHSMVIMQQEIFGPVLPIMPFDHEDEAVTLANDSPYGLNASVWTDDARRAQRVARRLQTGSCAINDVLKNIANPSTPFGGVKHSGFGRYHGPEGLRGFSHQRSLMSNPQALGREPNWLPYGAQAYETVKALVLSLYSDDSSLEKIKHAARGVRFALWGKKDGDD